MPEPKTFPCGGPNQPACPPQPAAIITEPLLYTRSEMMEHGHACYHKGKADEKANKLIEQIRYGGTV